MISKVFLDSNIIFSIAYSNKINKLNDIFLLQEYKQIEIFISELVKQEVIRNIQIKKSENLQILKELLLKTKILKNITTDLNYPEITKLPINYKIILTTAISYRMDFFITGNTKDFNPLYFRKIDNTVILKPNDFLNK